MGAPSTPGTGGEWTPPTVEHLQTLLPQYEISRLLGYGGMGAVYEGVQPNLDRTVAIKLLPETLSANEDGLNFKERFKLEARSMARLDHPGIISVYDFGETREGQLYFVMEFIDGMDIHNYLKHEGGRLPVESAIAITVHVLDALGYAHGKGVVHRDIKPANIMIKSDGRVKVADFGLVKRLSESGDGSPDSTLTQTNIAIGTPDFVAPESLEIGRVVDHRADLYAVGVMLYQMLTGSVPRGNFRPPSGRVPGLDPRLDPIVSRAMESDPADRFADAEEFRAAVDEILAAPVPEDGNSPPQPGKKESTGAITPGGKRLHITSVKRKIPAGAAGPVNRPTRKEPAIVAAPKKKMNPGLIAAVAVIGIAVIGGAAFVLSGKDRNPPILAEASGGGSKAKAGGQAVPTPVTKPKQGSKGREKPRTRTEPHSGSKPQPKPNRGTKAPERSGSKTPPKVANSPEPRPPAETRRPREARPAEVDPVPASQPAAVSELAVASPATDALPVTEPDAVAGQLAEIESKYRNYFEQPYQEALATLNQQFTDALKREEQAASQTGDLELVLAFQNEANQIGNGLGAGPADAAEAPPRLKELRSTWHTQVAAIEAAREVNRSKADTMRDQSLELLQQELVKAQDIEAARRVKALRDRFSAGPDGSGSGPDATPSVLNSGDPSPGKLSGIASVGAPKADLSAAEGFDDFVSIEVGNTHWAAIRANGQVVSSLNWLNGMKDVERVIFELGTGSDKAWVIRRGGRVEGETGRGPNELRAAVDFYHSKFGHGSAIARDGSIDVWGSVYEENPEEYEKPPETEMRAIQLAGVEDGREFRVHALLEDGSIVSWGSRAISYPLPEGESFQAIAALFGGVFVLADSGRAFVCVREGAIPYAVSRGPFTGIRGHGPIRAVRMRDGTWFAEGGVSQAAILTKIKSFGAVEDMDFSEALLMWIEPPNP